MVKILRALCVLSGLNPLDSRIRGNDSVTTQAARTCPVFITPTRVILKLRV
jgi:hypothetical protein